MVVHEYEQLIQRQEQLGITHTIFAPSNSAVSTRANNTDWWGWEFCLFLTLGEDIRQGYWVPKQGTIPESPYNIF